MRFNNYWLLNIIIIYLIFFGKAKMTFISFSRMHDFLKHLVENISFWLFFLISFELLFHFNKMNWEIIFVAKYFWNGWNSSSHHTNFFKGLENTLQSLNLANNDLRNVPVGPLRTLRLISQLDLSSNQVSNLWPSGPHVVRHPWS